MEQRINPRQAIPADDTAFTSKFDLYALKVQNLTLLILLGKSQIINNGETVRIPIYLLTVDDQAYPIGNYDIPITDSNHISDPVESQRQLTWNQHSSYATINLKFLHTPPTFLDDITIDFLADKAKECPCAKTNNSCSSSSSSSSSINSHLGFENLACITKELITTNGYDDLPPIRQKSFRLIRDSDGLILSYLIDSVQPLPLETKEQSDATIHAYISPRRSSSSSRSLWIQDYMRNAAYMVAENEGGGDCFFSSVRDAYASIGQFTTVAQLRQLLSESVDQAFFNTYVDQHKDMQQMAKEAAMEVQQASQLTRLLTSSTEPSIDPQLIQDVKSQYHDAKRNRREVAKVVNDVSQFTQFVNHVDTLQKFRHFILTSQCWADARMIVRMETLLNMKIILFTQHTQSIIDSISVSSDDHQFPFRPEFYIMLENPTNHFRLIGYADKWIFRFDELPYRLKELIVLKYLPENKSSVNVYSNIPDFRSFATHVYHPNDVFGGNGKRRKDRPLL